MEKLFDETFSAEDLSFASRNIWYGYVELYATAEYGKDIILNGELSQMLLRIIQHEASDQHTPNPTEINWYFYGVSATEDAIGDTVRPTVMVRYKQGDFLVRCNINDNDFAVNIEKVLLFEKNLEELLRAQVGKHLM